MGDLEQDGIGRFDMGHDFGFPIWGKWIIVKSLDHTGIGKIVKLLDDTPYPPLLDHIGVALWQAAQGWKAEFDRQMVAQGYRVFGEAASGILGHIGPAGIGQQALARQMAVTKQATQQFVDALVGQGIVLRRPDPEDARGKIVVLTPSGKAMMAQANAVKLAIEADYRARLGAAEFAALEVALRVLARPG